VMESPKLAGPGKKKAATELRSVTASIESISVVTLGPGADANRKCHYSQSFLNK